MDFFFGPDEEERSARSKDREHSKQSKGGRPRKPNKDQPAREGQRPQKKAGQDPTAESLSDPNNVVCAE